MGVMSADDTNNSDPYDSTRDANADIASARIESQRDGKFILLSFGANWCPDCHALYALCADPSVQTVLEASFRVVSIDIGRRDRNLDVAAAYGDVTKKGIPALVVINASGHVVADSRDGQFSNARSMAPMELLAFLVTASA